MYVGCLISMMLRHLSPQKKVASHYLWRQRVGRSVTPNEIGEERRKYEPQRWEFPRFQTRVIIVITMLYPGRIIV
jgi:hypothetical protein